MKEELEFHDPSSRPWEQVDGIPGLYERIIAGERGSPNHSRMLRFDPGCVTPETLTHDFWEEVWILSGSLRDLRLDQTFGAGMYACRPPGMPHGPWDTKEGCVTFEVRYAGPHRGVDG
jgi:ChrR Cupin-like domain